MRKDRFQERHDREEDIEPLGLFGGQAASVTRYLLAKLNDPNALQSADNEQVVWDLVPANLTISKITLTLDIDTEEVAGDLVYADDFINKANPVVINPFDTTSGVLSDLTITVPNVPAGKAMYLAFDSAPSVNIKQMLMTITFTFD